MFSTAGGSLLLCSPDPPLPAPPFCAEPGGPSAVTSPRPPPRPASSELVSGRPGSPRSRAATALLLARVVPGKSATVLLFAGPRVTCLLLFPLETCASWFASAWSGARPRDCPTCPPAPPAPRAHVPSRWQNFCHYFCLPPSPSPGTPAVHVRPIDTVRQVPEAGRCSLSLRATTGVPAPPVPGRPCSAAPEPEGRQGTRGLGPTVLTPRQGLAVG